MNAGRDLALFTSIPREEGWTVTIDGVPVPILGTANDTFICVEVPEGAHEIELSFSPAGMKTGLILTAGGAVMLAAMIVIKKFAGSPRSSSADADNEELPDNSDEENDDG